MNNILAIGTLLCMSIAVILLITSIIKDRITKRNILKTLDGIGACLMAMQWAENKKSWKEVIHTCKRWDWLLWLDKRLNVLTNQERRLLACWFVKNIPLSDGKTMQEKITDERIHQTIEAIEQYARKEISHERMAEAGLAARSIARSSNASVDDPEWIVAELAARFDASEALMNTVGIIASLTTEHIRNNMMPKRIIQAYGGRLVTACKEHSKKFT